MLKPEDLIRDFPDNERSRYLEDFRARREMRDRIARESMSHRIRFMAAKKEENEK